MRNELVSNNLADFRLRKGLDNLRPYGAEKQALRCMQKALRKARAEALRQGIQVHIEQTQVQIERAETAMDK